jgi:hypothetical protein
MAAWACAYALYTSIVINHSYKDFGGFFYDTVFNYFSVYGGPACQQIYRAAISFDKDRGIAVPLTLAMDHKI